ncbi:MAG: hypothetical protein ACI857_001947 [Arenicella sp.]
MFFAFVYLSKYKHIVIRYLSVILLLIGFNSFSQKIRVTAMNRDFEKFRNASHFDFVNDDFDTTKLTWVNDLTIKFDTASDGMIGECYKLLKTKANRFGANAFKVKESDVYKRGRGKFITISTYMIRMENRVENLSLMNSNTVYLFGLLGHHSSIPGYKVLVNEQDHMINELTYFKLDCMDKEKIYIRLGSKSRGAEKRLAIEEGMRPKFFYFHMVKGSFKNAWIDEYSPNFGMFLSQVLRKAS